VAPGSETCWALSSSDTAPVTIALDATVTLIGPDGSGWRTTYRKLRRRGSIDFPILGVAAADRLGAGAVVEDARIVLGAVHTHPVEATDAADFLRGKALTAEAIEMVAGIAYKPARPLDNADLVYSWRKRMARVEVTRALRELAGLPTGDLSPSLL